MKCMRFVYPAALSVFPLPAIGTHPAGVNRIASFWTAEEMDEYLDILFSLKSREELDVCELKEDILKSIRYINFIQRHTPSFEFSIKQTNFIERMFTQTLIPLSDEGAFSKFPQAIHYAEFFKEDHKSNPWYQTDNSGFLISTVDDLFQVKPYFEADILPELFNILLKSVLLYSHKDSEGKSDYDGVNDIDSVRIVEGLHCVQLSLVRVTHVTAEETTFFKGFK